MLGDCAAVLGVDTAAEYNNHLDHIRPPTVVGCRTGSADMGPPAESLGRTVPPRTVPEGAANHWEWRAPDGWPTMLRCWSARHRSLDHPSFLS